MPNLRILMVFQYRCSHQLRYHLLSLVRRGDRNSLHISVRSHSPEPISALRTLLYCYTDQECTLIFREKRNFTWDGTSNFVNYGWRCNYFGDLGQNLFLVVFKMLPRYVTLSRPVTSIPDHRQCSNCSTAAITHL